MIRPVWELACGRENLISRARRVFSGTFSFVHSFFNDQSTYSGWFLNGATLWEACPDIGKNEVYETGGVPGFFYAENLRREDLQDQQRLEKILKGRKKIQGKERYLRTLADFLTVQEEVLEKDLSRIKSLGAVPRGVIVLGKKDRIYLEEGAQIHPGAALDTRNGHIYISAEAEVMPFSMIQGPAFIGEKTLIDKAKIGGGCSFFTGCKIGGEVEASIFLDYVNKHHEGFVGHSYAGSFVNFGALSTTSDLKNNYSSVKVLLSGKTLNQGILKLGSFIGDHAKLGIGSLLSAGTVVGVGANLYAGKGTYPKWIPSFAWGSEYPFQKYRWEEFQANTEKILSRRGKTLSHGETEILRTLYQTQSSEIYRTLSFDGETS